MTQDFSRRGRSGVAAALVITFAGTAAAQSEGDRGAARAAAEAGDSAFRAGRYQEAADYFERAERLVHAPTLLLFMARSHAKLGHYVKARESYIRITRETIAANAPAAFRTAQESARAELPDVESKVAKLTISVDGAPRTGLRLTFDGNAISSDVVGLPYPVDPGKHLVQATAEGHDTASAEVVLKEAESGQVRLHLTEVETPAGGTGPTPATTSTPGETTPPQGGDTGTTGGGTSAMRIGAYVGFGVGAVGVGLGTLFLVQHFGKQSDSDDKFKGCDAKGCSDTQQGEIHSLDQDAATKGTLSIVMYSIGAAGLATGITLLVLDGGAEKKTEAGVRPYFTGTGAGLVGRF